jgi:hypothetical protein
MTTTRDAGRDVSEHLVPNSTDSTLASLAYINVTWEESKTSYLDNFVPFALEALRVAGARQTPLEVKQAILARFGLDFPVNVVRSLLDRGVKKKQIKRVPQSQALELAPGVSAKLPDLVAQQADCKREQGYLVRGLRTFAGARFDVTWDDGAAEEALIEYVETHALPMLASTVRGSAFTESEDPSTGRGYVVSAYVADIVAHDPAGFGYLDQMIKGSMLASALYVEAKGQVSRRFKKTTLFLDTPICLRALGHEGPEAREATRAMLGLALAEGAELACFKHSLNEMRGVLRGVKSLLRRTPGAETSIRGVAKHYRDTGGTPSDVDLAIATLEIDLGRNRIDVRSTPEYSSALGVDENELQEALQKFVRYRDTATLLPDLSSLTAIHRLRHGSSDAYLETCGAVLITNNANLVRASRNFFNSGRHEWPLAMLDSTTSTLLWVKSPTKAPDLPRRQIIADCYSALAPTSTLWTKFVEEVDRLSQRGVINEESVALLRYSHEAEQALMDATFGDPRKVSERVIQSTLARARQTAAAPAEEARLKALARAVAAEQAETESRFETERQVAEAKGFKDRLSVLETRHMAREAAIRTRITRRAGHFAIAAKVVAALVVATSILVGIGSFFPRADDWIPHIAELPVQIGALVGFFIGVLTLWKGKSVVEWIEHLRDRAIERAILREGVVEVPSISGPSETP